MLFLILRMIDKYNSDAIEYALEMVGMEFFNVTIDTDDHNEDIK